MLFEIRRKDGSIDPFLRERMSMRKVKKHASHKEDLVLRALGDNWKRFLQQRYVSYSLENCRPQLSLELERVLRSLRKNLRQLSMVPTYWEGAITFAGNHSGQPVRGAGYLEMTVMIIR